jgi:hypothetical protein
MGAGETLAWERPLLALFASRRMEAQKSRPWEVALVREGKTANAFIIKAVIGTLVCGSTFGLLIAGIIVRTPFSPWFPILAYGIGAMLTAAAWRRV